MMSIDLFKTILEQKASIVASTHSTHKSIIKTLYNYYKHKKFIDNSIIKNQEPVTYQFLYNFINFILIVPNGINIEHKMGKDHILFYDQYENRNLNFFKISYLIKSNNEEPDILYEYSIYPNTSPGEIRFEYTKRFMRVRHLLTL